MVETDKYEYKVISVYDEPDVTNGLRRSEATEIVANRWGQEGWRVVCVELLGGSQPIVVLERKLGKLERRVV